MRQTKCKLNNAELFANLYSEQRNWKQSVLRRNKRTSKWQVYKLVSRPQKGIFFVNCSPEAIVHLVLKALLTSKVKQNITLFALQNRSFPSSLVPLFQSKFKCETFFFA